MVMGSAPLRIKEAYWSNTPKGEALKSEVFFGNTVFLNIKTEGLNGYKSLEISIFNSEGDKHISTVKTSKVIDGNTIAKFDTLKVTIPKKVDSFYVKIKSPNDGNMVEDGAGNEIFAKYLKVKNSMVIDTPPSPTNKTFTTVGSVNKNYNNSSPCRYDKIIITDKDSNKDEFDTEIYDATKNPTILPYETIAGSSESSKKQLKLSYKKFEVKKCFTKENHKKEVEIFIDGKKQKTEVIKGEDVTVDLMADTNMILLRTYPHLYFLSLDKISKYQIITKTCAQSTGVLNINVYPNIERELAFVLTLLKGRSKENNNKISQQESLIEYDKKNSLKLVRNIKETLVNEKGGFGLSLQAKVKVDNVESSIELAETRSQIKKLIDFNYKVNEVLSIFDGGKAAGTPDKYIRRPGIKWTFDIEPPNVALALRLTNKKINKSNEIVRQFNGAIALKPILKFKFSVDVLSLLQYFGIGGKIADWLKTEIEKEFEFTLYLIIESSLEAKAEISLNYNKVEGFEPGRRKLEIEAALAVKGGAKSTGDNNMVIVLVPEADGKMQKVKVEKWKAEATATSSILYTYEINADNKGQYSQHKLEFTGLKATIIVYSIRQGMQYNESLKKEFTVIEKPKEPWFKSDKEYII